MKPVLFDIVNSLYLTAEKIMPEFLRERPVFSAASLAAIGVYGLGMLASRVSKKYVVNAIPNFDRNFRIIETAIRCGIPVAAIVYSAVDPQGAKDLLMQHPVYTAGMAGAYAGGCASARTVLNSEV